MDISQQNREVFQESYPVNLLRTINSTVWLGSPVPIDTLTQDNLDGLLLALSKLPERVQNIIHLRFAKKLTNTKIGERYGLSGMRVSSLVRKAVFTLCTPPQYEYILYGKIGYEAYQKRLAEERMQIAPELMQTSVLNIGLPERISRRLIAIGCLTISDLVYITRDDIKEKSRLGLLSIREVDSVLQRFGINNTDWSKFESIRINSVVPDEKD